MMRSLAAAPAFSRLGLLLSPAVPEAKCETHTMHSYLDTT